MNFKIEQEAADLFDKMHQLALAENQGLTKSVFLENIINAYANPKIQHTDNPEHIARIAELEKDLNRIAELEKELLQRDDEISNYLDGSKSDVNFINALRSMLELTADDDGDAILAEIKATQNRAFMALQPPPNQIAFTIPEIHLKLLTETAKLLSEKYGTTVTMKDILLDMFIRYTVDQYAQWFYPFVVKEDQFEIITGKTQNQLKQWLKTK